MIFGCIPAYNHTLSFLVWIAGDNDLEQFISQDLKEMIGNPSWINVFALVDYRSSSSDTLYRVEEDLIPLETFDEVNSGDPIILSSFLNGYRGEDLSFLVIWNHGDWWRGESQKKVKGVAYDFTDLDFFTISEIKSVLRGSPVTVLGFDACLMGTFEILWELKDCARYIVVSSKEVPGNGWDYSVLRYSKDISSLLSNIVKRYGEIYGTEYSLSVWDTSKLAEIMLWLNRVAQYMIESNLSPWEFEVERRVVGGSATELVELGSFAKSLQNSSDSVLREYGEGLYSAIVSARIYGTPDSYTDLTIYLPQKVKNPEYWDDFVALNDFTSESSWDDLIEHWRDRN